MNDIQIAEKLFKEGAIGEDTREKVVASHSNRLFSLGIELRTLLYIGILSLASGLGVLVYKNIDSIGHVAVVTFIALVSLGCFAYSYTRRLPYSNQKVVSTNILADYILLLGCLTFATFMGYIQYQFSIFGPHNEFAFLIPAIVFFSIAYYFDHVGVLSMAITALAGFIGITITPLELLQSNDFSSNRIIYSGLGLGIALAGTALLLDRREIKKHFTFTYLNFSVHLLFIAALAGLFTEHMWVVFIALITLIEFVVLRYAYREKSFYFLLFSVIYGYIAISYLFFRLFLFSNNSDSLVLLGPLYFIGSSIYTIVFLIRANKKFKPHADI